MILRGFGIRELPVEDQIAVYGVPHVMIPQTRQVHGNTVAMVTSSMGGLMIEADAFVATEPGVVCIARTADCIPILIWDVRERIAAAVHAGWRGVASEIVSRTVREIYARFPDADLRVAMGPAISASCYEVGEEMVTACAATVEDITTYLQRTRSGHSLINLKGIVMEQLERLGVTANCVDDLPICTHCDVRYASYRRGDRKERQYSWILIV